MILTHVLCSEIQLSASKHQQLLLLCSSHALEGQILIRKLDATISSQNGVCPTHYLAVLLTKPESRCGSLCASDKFRSISEEPEELRSHFTVVIPSYFMFFMTFLSLIVHSM